MANNGDRYSCVVSNFANSSPHAITSASATLTVAPNRAPLAQVLFGPTPGYRDSHSGVVGGVFQAGDIATLVTHVGYYCANGFLNLPHNIGIWNEDGTSLLASQMVPAGTAGYLTNGYMWVALDVPLMLTPNRTYLLGAEVFSSSGDPWPDVFVPLDWNPYFVGGEPDQQPWSSLGLGLAGGAAGDEHRQRHLRGSQYRFAAHYRPGGRHGADRRHPVCGFERCVFGPGQRPGPDDAPMVQGLRRHRCRVRPTPP